MFGRATDRLFAALPHLEGLEAPAVRQLLSRAWLEVAERRELSAGAHARSETIRDLWRLATALQVHAVLAPTASAATAEACSFVAAEALDIARELAGADHVTDNATQRERLLVGLLYFIAGYDANARVAVLDLQVTQADSPTEAYAAASLRALLIGAEPPSPPADPEEGVYLHERVRSALWKRLGDLVAEAVRWLREPGRPADGEPEALARLAAGLRLNPDDMPVVVDADVQHLARVGAVALEKARSRAVRLAAVPLPRSSRFERFLAARCRSQPLLWPAAAEYARRGLTGPSRSAVVAVPTGAGKSGIADLAIQHALGQGWVLYLAPTNALVGQIRRQLRRDHPGVVIRDFVGGVEYTAAPSEALGQVGDDDVLVMTPEKCAMAIRQTPEAFADLALLIFDEAHLLGDYRGRGALSEVVLAEVLSRAPNAAVILMSALIANPEDLSEWLSDALGSGRVMTIREPWRPTRTLRAVVGIDRAGTIAAAEEPAERLAALPVRRRNVQFEAPLALLAGLRGPWSTRDKEDYALVKLATTTAMDVTRPRGGGEVSIAVGSFKVRPTVEALAQRLGAADEKVMAFLPRSKHDSFAAALSIPGFGETRVGASVEALLALARAELGTETLLAGALAKGVGVHTSALLPEERRATELAFEEGDASVLFATGTLAEGLNLPATVVIVGGTDIGYDPEQTAAERQRQQRSQLLNAIGRAGRARVAARSLALVVPNTPPVLDEDTVVGTVLPRAEFLAEEDASTHLASVLAPFLARLQRETLEPWSWS